MLTNGSKVEHVIANNFISEMVDAFNVSGIQTGVGAKISVIVGRDVLSVRRETLTAHQGGFSSDVLAEDMVLSRHVVANLTIPLENAKSLIAALQTAVMQMESSNNAPQNGSL